MTVKHGLFETIRKNENNYFVERNIAMGTFELLSAFLLITNNLVTRFVCVCFSSCFYCGDSYITQLKHILTFNHFPNTLGYPVYFKYTSDSRSKIQISDLIKMIFIKRQQLGTAIVQHL